MFKIRFSVVSGTDTCPMKTVVRRIGQQLVTALSTKGLALLVNHGIAEEKVCFYFRFKFPTWDLYL